jgi:hypothetical protein
LDSPVARTERPISAKTTGTGLRAGHEALVTSPPEQVPGEREEDGFQFKVIVFRHRVSSLKEQMAKDPGTRAVFLQDSVMERCGWAGQKDLCSNPDFTGY